MTEAEQHHIFKQWLHEHKGLMFKVVRAYGRTAMDQEDLFQEVTLQVWRSIPSFRQESAVTTWIYRIALNTAIKWMTKERQYRQANTVPDNVPDLLLPTGNPVDEQLNWLYNAIHQMDAIDRSIIVLWLDNYSYKEMSAILGITESHVGVKINRIKKQLRLLSKKIV